MVQHIFVGVDGGASKCRVRVEDEQGNRIGYAEGSDASIRYSVKHAWESVYQTLHQALQNSTLSLSDPDCYFHIGLGLAGTEVPEACYQFSTAPHAFKTLVLKSDGYIACVGAHGGRDGAIITVGTGIVAWQIEQESTIRVSGWGFPHGDEGSGAWLGLEAVRRTMHWYDGRTEASPLYEAILAKFNHNFSDLVTWVNQENCHSRDYAALAPIVIEYAHEKEPVAFSLLQQAVEHIHLINESLIKRSKDPHHLLPCVLEGGLARFMEPWVNESLKSRLVPCQYEPVIGAVIMIKKQVQAKLNRDNNLP